MNRFAKFTAGLLALGLLTMPHAWAAQAAGKITVDGDDRDWAAVEGVALNAGNGYTLTGWKAAKDQDGTVYLCITGTANQYNVGNLQWESLFINGNWNQLAALYQQPGVTYAVGCDASGTTYGPFVLELSIPADLLPDSDYQLTFAGTSIPSSSIPELDGVEIPDKEPVYEGITIDGSFSDWDAVVKTDGPGCTNDAHPNCVESSAMVFDGDYVYLYIKEKPGMNAAGAGSHSNGKFAITTDLGRTMLVDLESNGTVAGISGAQCAHTGTQWEIAIPASALPQFRQSLSFGLYQNEPVITGVQNLDGSGGNTGSFTGITIDGSYRDWDSYPHTLIEYATAGTQSQVPDGEFALYSEDGMLYGHTVTEYEPHMTGGYDLAHAISFAFNGDREYKDLPEKGGFYPVLVEVDSAGNISYADVGNLSNGTHEFYLMDTRSWHKSTNINDLQGDDRIFGRMLITVEDGREQCEYEIDLKEVAAYIGCKAEDFDLIEVQFGRIGQQWTSCAGTSTGPVLGVALCLAAVGGVWLLQKRKEKTA